MVKKISLFLLVAICFSCEDQRIFVNCSECGAEEPLDTYLEIKLEGYVAGPVLINLYEGTLEDNVLYSSFTTSDPKTTVLVMVNKKYTVTATYNLPPNKYIAVDSAFPRVRYAKDQCKDPCYWVYDRVCNLKLKYTK